VTAGDYMSQAHTQLTEFQRDLQPHTKVFQADASPEDLLTRFRGSGAVHNYIALCRDHSEKAGVGADYVKTLFR